MSYDRMCRHVLLFFDATLKQQAAARECLQKSVRGEGLDDGFRLKFKPAAPVPTDESTTRGLPQEERGRENRGVDRVDCQRAEEPVGRPAGDRLAAAADASSRTATRLRRCLRSRCAIKEYPKMAVYQVWLGQALALTGDRAVRWRRTGRPPNCSRATRWRGTNREAYKYLIDKGLKDLGSSEPPKDR